MVRSFAKKWNDTRSTTNPLNVTPRCPRQKVPRNFFSARSTGDWNKIPAGILMKPIRQCTRRRTRSSERRRTGPSTEETRETDYERERSVGSQMFSPVALLGLRTSHKEIK
jgi:hypothetical protein